MISWEGSDHGWFLDALGAVSTGKRTLGTGTSNFRQKVLPLGRRLQMTSTPALAWLRW